MNYRHHYHAGNYADVFKHVLLLQLIRAMQRKEKGFLYLDTHAGRGGYDLTMPSVLPDGRTREAEHPAGIGRLWAAPGLPPVINDYLAVVKRFNERRGVKPSCAIILVRLGSRSCCCGRRIGWRSANCGPTMPRRWISISRARPA